MFTFTFTIADTHIHAIGVKGKAGDDGKTVRVFAVDLFSGQTHVDTLTEREASTLLAVASNGDDYDLPSKLLKEAARIVEHWPLQCRPIP